MRIPKRRGEEFRKAKKGTGPIYLTRAGIQAIHDELRNIEKELPTVVQTVQETREMGDLSENAAYQIAKGKMRRMHTRLLVLNERLKNVIEIQKGKHDFVQLGSTVVLQTSNGEKIYTLVDSYESDPANGFISWHAPIGKQLRNKHVGFTFDFNGSSYTIDNIN